MEILLFVYDARTEHTKSCMNTHTSSFIHFKDPGIAPYITYSGEHHLSLYFIYIWCAHHFLWCVFVSMPCVHLNRLCFSIFPGNPYRKPGVDQIKWVKYYVERKCDVLSMWEIYVNLSYIMWFKWFATGRTRRRNRSQGSHVAVASATDWPESSPFGFADDMCMDEIGFHQHVGVYM